MTQFRNADRPLDYTELQPLPSVSTRHEYKLTMLVVFVAAVICTLVAL